jgi:hypothetical protein
MNSLACLSIEGIASSARQYLSPTHQEFIKMKSVPNSERSCSRQGERWAEDATESRGRDELKMGAYIGLNLVVNAPSRFSYKEKQEEIDHANGFQ